MRDNGAHERNRTVDLLLTMEMLYRLSYVGGAAALSCMERRGPFDPTSTRSRDGAYVMLRLKAENPNQPLSSVEKGCGDCEPMNV